MKKILITITFLLTTVSLGGLIAAADPGGVPPISAGPRLAADFLNPATWQMECIYCRKLFDRMSNRSAAIDSDGLLHAAYGEDHLYYGHRSSSGDWTSETVDASFDVGWHAALALDSSDQPHILYLGQSAGQYLYAFMDQGSWQIEAVPYDPIIDPSFTLDGQDEPGVSFYDEDTADLIYAHRDDSGWDFTIVDEVGDVGLKSWIDFDADNEPHIAYHDRSNDCLKYAEFSDPDWLVTDFCDPDEEVREISLAIASDGAPHIAALIEIGYDDALVYRFWDGIDWVQETEILPCDDMGGNLTWCTGVGSLSIVLDDGDFAHLSYTQSFDVNAPAYYTPYYRLQYARRTLAGWEFEESEALPTSSWNKYLGYSTILLNLDGTPSIVYKDSDHLGYLEREIDGSWLETELEQTGFVMYGPSIGWSSNGYPQVGFYTQDAYRHLLRQNGEWTSGGGRSNAYPTYPGPVLVSTESGGAVHFTTCPAPRYYGPCMCWNGTPMGDYLYGGVGASEFDGAQNPDGSVNLIVWTSSLPPIFPPPPSELRYYHTYNSYDVIDHSGSGISIDHDSSGTPYIFFSGSPLEYIVKTSSGWTEFEVAGASGSGPEVKFNSLDQPHVIFYSAGSLSHAYYNGTAWVTEIVDDQGDVGKTHSLAIDPFDRLHISYYDDTNGDLKYAFNDGVGWRTMTLASEGDVGAYSSITVDPLGFPKIAFFDTTNRDLLYIYQEFSPSHFYYFPIIGRN